MQISSHFDYGTFDPANDCICFRSDQRKQTQTRWTQWLHFRFTLCCRVHIFGVSVPSISSVDRRKFIIVWTGSQLLLFTHKNWPQNIRYTYLCNFQNSNLYRNLLLLYRGKLSSLFCLLRSHFPDAFHSVRILLLLQKRSANSKNVSSSQIYSCIPNPHIIVKWKSINETNKGQLSRKIVFDDRQRSLRDNWFQSSRWKGNHNRL